MRRLQPQIWMTWPLLYLLVPPPARVLLTEPSVSLSTSSRTSWVCWLPRVTLCCASFASNLFIGRCKSSSWCIAWGLFLCYHFKKRSNGHARIHGNLLIKLVWSSSMKCVTAIAFTNLTRRDEQYCNLSNIQNSCCDLLWQFRFNGKIPSYAPVRKGCTKHCCAKTDRILVMAMVLEEWLVRISTLCRVLKPWAP